MIQKEKEIRITQDYGLLILCVFFGIGTWLPTNAIFSQMPIFVQFLPEGWSLPSYFSVLVQCANIIPFLYYIFNKKLKKFQSTLICTFLIIGSVSLFCLAFTYRITGTLFNRNYSIYFFVFSFALASVGCTSSVLFLPFMNKLPEMYLVPFFIGEGLSGLIPSIVALVQGIYKEGKCIKTVMPNGTVVQQYYYEEPLFTSKLFLIIIGVIMLISTVSFFYLNYFSNFIKNSNNTDKLQTQNQNSAEIVNLESLSTITFSMLLLLQMVINAFANGILLSIQSFSCLPYGTEAYYWSVNLNQITSPVIIYFAYFIPLVSFRILNICCLLLSFSLFIELFTALMSPTPPLKGTIIGMVLIVSLFLFAY